LCSKNFKNVAGIIDIIHINTTDFSIIKGETPFSEEKAMEIADYIRKLNKKS